MTGDFNDVAWSDTSRTFKRFGQYLDPRIGRGFFASFGANKAYLRFPIDQLYVTEDIAMVSIERCAYIGSDHFPMAATLRLDAGMPVKLNVAAKPVSQSERKLIEDAIARTRNTLGHPKL